MKRLLSLLLILLFLPLSGAFCFAEDEEIPATELYVGKMRLSAKVFSDWDGTTGINHITSIPKGVWVKIYALNPTFAYVSYPQGNISGYVIRVCIEQMRTVDSLTTPPYGVDFNHYIASIGAESAAITTEPGGGDTLITLYKGAKVSFIGFEDGYAKLIYHRRYGYINSNLLADVDRVYYDTEYAGIDAPIASYTSFYKITTDESNRNRMHNIAVACRKLCELPLPAGSNLNFNRDIGPYRASEGYLQAGALVDGELTQGYGGGTCQVSSTLYNVVLQLPGLTVLQRRAHGDNGASYLPIGVDAAVGNSALNFRFRNDYPFPIRIDASSQDGALTIAIYRAE